MIPAAAGTNVTAFTRKALGFAPESKLGRGFVEVVQYLTKMKTSQNDDGSPVVVLGAGGTGLYMADCISRVEGCKFAGFLDDDLSKQEQGYEGLRVLGALKIWSQLDSSLLFVTSLYAPKKMQYFHALVESLGIPSERWGTIIDPQAVVCSGAQIGKGSFVGPGSVMEPAAILGACCALLGNVYVAHHTVLEDYVVCANSASIAGGIRIGAASYIGANSTIREYLRIGAHAIVGMGAVVTNSVPDGVTVVGNPARPLGSSK